MSELYGVDLLYRLGNLKSFVDYKLPPHPMRDHLYSLMDLHEWMYKGVWKDDVANQIENVKSIMGYHYVD